MCLLTSEKVNLFKCHFLLSFRLIHLLCFVRFFWRSAHSLCLMWFTVFFCFFNNLAFYHGSVLQLQFRSTYPFTHFVVHLVSCLLFYSLSHTIAFYLLLSLSVSLSLCYFFLSLSLSSSFFFVSVSLSFVISLSPSLLSFFFSLFRSLLFYPSLSLLPSLLWECSSPWLLSVKVGA